MSIDHIGNCARWFERTVDMRLSQLDAEMTKTDALQGFPQEAFKAMNDPHIPQSESLWNAICKEGLDSDLDFEETFVGTGSDNESFLSVCRALDMFAIHERMRLNYDEEGEIEQRDWDKTRFFLFAALASNTRATPEAIVRLKQISKDLKNFRRLQKSIPKRRRTGICEEEFENALNARVAEILFESVEFPRIAKYIAACEHFLPKLQ
jgi:hypothetical protein